MVNWDINGDAESSWQAEAWVWQEAVYRSLGDSNLYSEISAGLPREERE
jgi:hypothetical protein